MHLGTCGEHDIDLRATGKTAHGVARDELGEVLLYLAANEELGHVKATSLAGIDQDDFLYAKQIDQLDR